MSCLLLKIILTLVENIQLLWKWNAYIEKCCWRGRHQVVKLETAVELWGGFSTSVLSCCQHGFTNLRKSTSGTSADLQDMMMMFVSADVNDCAGQPCENGGTCRDLDGDFKCHCPSPYVGKHCQLRKSDQSHHWTIIRTTLRLQQLLCTQVLTND